MHTESESFINNNDTAPAQTPEKELEQIRTQQKRELVWYKDIPTIETLDDLARAIETGHAVPIPTEGDGYKVSATIPEEFRYTSQKTKSILDEITHAWKNKVQTEYGSKSENYFLVVSSLARTKQYQQNLIDRGYPALPESTHTKLGAFDIGITWLRENEPRLLDILNEVIQEKRNTDHVNIIEEPSIGAYHFCVKPIDQEI